MRHRIFLGIAALAALGTAACGGGESGAAGDAGTSQDAGTSPDAGGGAADAGTPDAGTPDAGPVECLYEPDPSAFERTRKTQGGIGILPNGRSLTPAGEQVTVGLLPGNMLLTPDGKTLIVSNNGHRDRSISLVDTAQKTVRQTIAAPHGALFYGLAVTQDGATFYAAGGAAERIYEYVIGQDGTAALSREIAATGGYPTGLALSRDGQTLYAAHWTIGVVTAYDLAAGTQKTSGSGGKYPFAIALSADGAALYVSNWGQKKAGADPTVTVLDAADLSKKAEIVVGKNPETIVDDTAHGRLFVLNSDQETISVVDPLTNTVTKTISLLSAPDAPTGVFPLGAALSPDAKTLYVAAANKDALLVVDIETLAITGAIPVGWYPNAVAVSTDGATLYVLNAKGEGSGPNLGDEYVGDIQYGTVSVLNTPDPAALADHTKKAEANQLRTTLFFPSQCQGTGFPIPEKRGDPSPIKHVIFVLKENRTFDQVFGDFEGAERDESLLMFGSEITPNAHKLAREFTLLDNYYCESEISVQGHLWATGMVVNDYSERTWLLPGDIMPLSGVEPATTPLNPMIFRHLYDHGIDFVDYGQIVGMGGQDQEIADHWDQSYPGVVYTTAIKDVVKVDYVKKRIAEGFLPAFTYMLLPNDHTEGTKEGRPTPESMVADNDEALGRLVEALSNSKFWDSTMIFVTEDDPQDGADHVDAHRTLALVISPWVRKGYISKVHHSIGSFFATWERILNAPPLNVNDAYAPPLYDCFTNIPDLTPYTHIPRNVPENVNTFMSPFAAESAEMDFSGPDLNHGLQRVLWHYMKGKDVPFRGRD